MPGDPGSPACSGSAGRSSAARFHPCRLPSIPRNLARPASRAGAARPKESIAKSVPAPGRAGTIQSTPCFGGCQHAGQDRAPRAEPGEWRPRSDTVHVGSGHFTVHIARLEQIERVHVDCKRHAAGELERALLAQGGGDERAGAASPAPHDDLPPEDALEK